ncbi:hypothetical protein [Nocardia africana]|uniref:Uncharacterized protein n=1 Tax=Nocardia africana TaxID=134964 RepID=A0ABW6NJ45_9NOCA
MTVPSPLHVHDRAEFTEPSTRSGPTPDPDTTVVQWPDPSPLQTWWDDVMRPSRHPDLVA